jgi:hypothetical protein
LFDISLNFPPGQLEHFPSEFAPQLSLYVPNPQVEHGLHDDWPPWSLYLPTIQLSQWALPLLAWNFPAMQSAHPVIHVPGRSIVPSDLYMPLAHAVQVPDELLPQLTRRTPGAHVAQVLQLGAPAFSLNLPVVQAAQCSKLERGKLSSP